MLVWVSSTLVTTLLTQACSWAVPAAPEAAKICLPSASVEAVLSMTVTPVAAPRSRMACG